MSNQADCDLSPFKNKKGALRILLVYKQSRLDVYRHKGLQKQIKSLAKNPSSNLCELQSAHQAHHDSLSQVLNILKDFHVTISLCKRSLLSDAKTRGRLVLTIGGDGTVLEASHFVKKGAILGLNSDPISSVGMLCATTTATLHDTMSRILAGKMPFRTMPRVGVAINGKLAPYQALNEVLFAHYNPAITTRFCLNFRDTKEEHRNSGVWISTPLGSSGATLSSGGKLQAIDDTRLQVLVREPYFTEQQKQQHLHFFIEKGQQLSITSRLTSARVFFDGPYQYAKVKLGDTLTIEQAAHDLFLFLNDRLEERRHTLENLRIRKGV